MTYLHKSLGFLTQKQTIKIMLSNKANVRLMDTTNFSKYKHGQNYKYFGGIPQTSPCILQVPNSGYWYVVIDMQGLPGKANASIQIL